MKAVVIMFDTLSRRFLSTYGCEWVPTPNFQRLEQKCTVMDNFYCGSTPCMPARRELHTGRYNFLHRSWGPLEPFDNSCIELLKTHGIYTHIITDHSHYWEDGGATYLTRYNSWQGFRGQEGDRWMPALDLASLNIPNLAPTSKQSASLPHNYANRQYQQRENQMSSVQTIEAGIDFLQRYHDQDQWFLQIECFDPHEPFVVPQRFLDLVNDVYQGAVFDWPAYRPVTESPEQQAHLIKRYGALIAMCDEYLGKILDVFDQENLWEDTLLIVNTDHGFLMGEHQWWGKNIQPHYQEIIHLPFYLHVPGQTIGGRSDLLTQTIDIAPTLLDHFDCPIPDEAQGQSLIRALNQGTEIREFGLCGCFGGHVNVITKNTVYMRASVSPENQPLYLYTLMPTNMRGFLPDRLLKQAELVHNFHFTQGIPVLKIPGLGFADSYRYGNLLFDLKEDPTQSHPLTDPALEQVMLRYLKQGLYEAEADEAQSIRLGLQ